MQPSSAKHHGSSVDSWLAGSHSSTNKKTMALRWYVALFSVAATAAKFDLILYGAAAQLQNRSTRCWFVPIIFKIKSFLVAYWCLNLPQVFVNIALILVISGYLSSHGILAPEHSWALQVCGKKAGLPQWFSSFNFGAKLGKWSKWWDPKFDYEKIAFIPTGSMGLVYLPKFGWVLW